jgi:hypothetical protein
MPGAPDREANMLKILLQRLRCQHEYKYSRTKPGTLVCKKCRARKGKP